MRGLRAAIFDLDGVIVDTARCHYEAWRRLAAELGFEFTPADNEQLKGVSRVDSLDILLRVGGRQGQFTASEKAELAGRKNAWYVEQISRLTPADLLPFVYDFLTAVRAAGIKTGLGSASRNTALIVSRLRIAELFDTVVDGTMVARSKPDPEVFLRCAALLGVEPGQCLVFEDAVAGIEAARRAGMRAVGIGNSPALTAAGAERLLPDFEGITISELF